jgi:hypothetical protein
MKDDLRPEYKRSDFTSLVRGKYAGQGPRHASKADCEAAGGMKSEYTRSDLGPLTRGKYDERLHKSSDVVKLDRDVAAAFPNGRAVNNALRSLMQGDKPRRRRSAPGERTRRPRRSR